MAKSTKGLKIYLEKDNATTVIKDGTNGAGTLTAIAANATDGTKTDLTVDAIAGIAVGDTVYLEKTGYNELDGKHFVVTAAAGTDITINADITGTSGSIDAAGIKATFLPAAQMELICASAISLSQSEPGTTSVATFCDATASIPSVVVEAGSLTLTSYHEPMNNGFKLMQSAAEVGDERTLTIVFPNNEGTLVATGTVSAFSISNIPLDGAADWTMTMALKTKPEFRV